MYAIHHAETIDEAVEALTQADPHPAWGSDSGDYVCYAPRDCADYVYILAVRQDVDCPPPWHDPRGLPAGVDVIRADDLLALRAIAREALAAALARAQQSDAEMHAVVLLREVYRAVLPAGVDPEREAWEQIAEWRAEWHDGDHGDDWAEYLIDRLDAEVGSLIRDAQWRDLPDLIEALGYRVERIGRGDNEHLVVSTGVPVGESLVEEYDLYLDGRVYVIEVMVYDASDTVDADGDPIAPGDLPRMVEPVAAKYAWAVIGESRIARAAREILDRVRRMAEVEVDHEEDEQATREAQQLHA